MGSPSPFIARWAVRLGRTSAGRAAKPRALDVAIGRGRHAGVLARAGFDVFGVDLSLEALRAAAARVAAAGGRLHAWRADLTRYPLPASHFDLVVVARYLQRDLFPALARALRPGGIALYETFTTAQRVHGRGPASPEYLLDPGELRARFDDLGFDILFYEEVTAPEAVARLVGRRGASARRARSQPHEIF